MIKSGEALQTIEGRVPAATRFPDGCRFADRCHKVIDSCHTWNPELIEVADGHRAACIHYDTNQVSSTLAPSDMVDAGASESVIGRGRRDGHLDIRAHDLRATTTDVQLTET